MPKRKTIVVNVPRRLGLSWMETDDEAGSYTFTNGSWTKYDSVEVDVNYVSAKDAIDAIKHGAARFVEGMDSSVEIEITEKYESTSSRVAVWGHRYATDSEIARIEEAIEDEMTRAKREEEMNRKMQDDEVLAFIASHPEFEIRPKS